MIQVPRVSAHALEVQEEQGVSCVPARITAGPGLTMGRLVGLWECQSVAMDAGYLGCCVGLLFAMNGSQRHSVSVQLQPTVLR